MKHVCLVIRLIPIHLERKKDLVASLPKWLSTFDNKIKFLCVTSGVERMSCLRFADNYSI